MPHLEFVGQFSLNLLRRLAQGVKPLSQNQLRDLQQSLRSMPLAYLHYAQSPQLGDALFRSDQLELDHDLHKVAQRRQCVERYLDQLQRQRSLTELEHQLVLVDLVKSCAGTALLVNQ